MRNFLSMRIDGQRVKTENNCSSLSNCQVTTMTGIPVWGRSTQSLTHSVIYSLTHLLTYSLTHLINYSLTHSLTYSLTDFTYSLTHTLTFSLTHSVLKDSNWVPMTKSVIGEGVVHSLPQPKPKPSNA